MSSTAAVRVRLRYSDLDTFIERFAPNVTRGGIFLASRAPRPVGEVFHFEVQLSNGDVALAGEGKVIWVKPFDAAEPQKPHGMGVQFVSIDGGSRTTLDRILQVKAGRPAAGAPASAGAGTSATASASPGGAPAAARSTQPHTLVARASAVGAGANGRPRVVDTSVDLATEYGIDDATLRRVIDRNWTLGPRGADDIETLLQPDASDPAPTIAEALADLPRLLDPTARHRSGAHRALEGLSRSTAPAREPTPKNGQSAHEPGEANGHEAGHALD